MATNSITSSSFRIVSTRIRLSLFCKTSLFLTFPTKVFLKTHHLPQISTITTTLIIITISIPSTHRRPSSQAPRANPSPNQKPNTNSSSSTARTSNPSNPNSKPTTTRSKAASPRSGSEPTSTRTETSSTRRTPTPASPRASPRYLSKASRVDPLMKSFGLRLISSRC
ncbi:hypothetical protein GLYMA_16G030402v4 [Glycine max]|nr:hypothetical protein GLYMA_16G030402v4 [Glycine max]KAH1149714.1 hypothetical protein GYH30_043979 [Glycine max]